MSSGYCLESCTVPVCSATYGIEAALDRAGRITCALSGRWWSNCARGGANILLGDPGRRYFLKSGIGKLGTYNVLTTRDLEDREIREAFYRLAA
jgi:hypothetical protein